MNGNYDSIKEIERVNNFLKKKSISKLKKII
ncbi:MAG: triose-phosphate isomerase, partial [Candidatus Fonsibacter ubiquis]|nr:triose-phosphate isomerase [Candidatus Fonsibacter ubiquis]